MILTLRKSHLLKIVQHGQETYPEECCGFLLGRFDQNGADLVEVVPAKNQHDSSRRNRYVISPAEYLNIEKSAEAKGLQVIGFYHSHPDHPARPSAFDLEHAWPNVIYLIQSVEAGEAGETRAFMLSHNRKQFDSIKLKVKEV